MKNISEDSRFLEMLLYVKSNDVLGTAIGSSQKALTMVGLNKLEFMFPTIEEQQKSPPASGPSTNSSPPKPKDLPRSRPTKKA